MKKLVQLICFSALYLTGTAQQQLPVDPLTLKQTIETALEYNQQLKRARLSEEEGKQKTREIRAQALPQISANANYTNNLILPKFILPGGIMGGSSNGVQVVEAGTSHNASAGAEVNQQIFNQSVFTGLKAAKKSEEYYYLQTAVTEEQVIQQTAIAFYQLQINRQKRHILDANILSTEKILATTASQYKNGLARRIDVDRLKVNRANLESQRNSLDNSITQAEQQLRYYLGVAPDAPVQFVDVPAASIQAEMDEVAGLTLGDITRLNDYKLLDKQKELLYLQKESFRAEYFPKLSLFGNYNRIGASNKFDLIKGDNGSSNWYSTAAVGIKLSIPIFDGNARAARVSQASIQIASINETIKETENALKLTLLNAQTQIANSITTIRIQEQNVQLAEQVYATTQVNFEQGLSNLTDLINAETDYTAARNNFSEALLQFKIAQINLLKASGSLHSLTLSK